jgi:hypothetical protein
MMGRDPYAPKGRRAVPMPRDLAEHQPIVPYDDGAFGERLDEVHRAAGALIRDPVRDVALALLQTENGPRRWGCAPR